MVSRARPAARAAAQLPAGPGLGGEQVAHPGRARGAARPRRVPARVGVPGGVGRGNWEEGAGDAGRGENVGEFPLEYLKNASALTENTTLSAIASNPRFDTAGERRANLAWCTAFVGSVMGGWGSSNATAGASRGDLPLHNPAAALVGQTGDSVGGRQLHEVGDRRLDHASGARVALGSALKRRVERSGGPRGARSPRTSPSRASSRRRATSSLPAAHRDGRVLRPGHRGRRDDRGQRRQRRALTHRLDWPTRTQRPAPRGSARSCASGRALRRRGDPDHREHGRRRDPRRGARPGLGDRRPDGVRGLARRGRDRQRRRVHPDWQGGAYGGSRRH